MELDKVDIFPEYCLSFSPNWYAHQILCIDNEEGIACYGSNDEVYVIDIAKKKIRTSITMRSMEVQKIQESSKKKVSAVLLSKEYLVYTNCRGYVGIFKKDGDLFDMVYLELLDLKKDIAYIRQIESEEPGFHFIMNDIEYLSIKCTFHEDKLDKTFIRRKGKPSRIKFFDVLSYQGVQFILLASEEGVIQVWDTNMKEQILHQDIKNRINCLDFLAIGDVILVAVYTKTGGLIISVINLKLMFDEMLEMKKSGKAYRETKSFQAKFEREEASKEAKFVMMSILWLDKHALLLSGKTGEVYQINLSLVKESQELLLKPYSIDTFGEHPYELLEDNPHYKSIYFFRRFENKVVSIGVDRMITFWDYNDDTILQDFTINCLGGKITQIIKSPTEKQLAIMIGYDNTIRVWDIGKTNNRFSTLTIWKKLSSKNILMGACHPTDEGLISFVTNKDELCIYHVYTHTLLKSLTKDKLNIAFMKWIPKAAVGHLYNEGYKNCLIGDIVKEENKEFECLFFKYQKIFKKELSNNYILFVFSRSHGVLFVDFVNDAIIQMNLNGFCHSVSSFDMWVSPDGQTSLTCAAEFNGTVNFIHYNDGKYTNKRIKECHSGVVSCLSFSMMDEENKLRCATGSFDRYIYLYNIEDIFLPSFEISRDVTIYAKLKHKYRITSLDFSPHSPYNLLNICEKHSTVQIWSTQFPQRDDRRLWNIRGHRGFLSSASFSSLSDNLVITSSEDQTVKVWDLEKIKNRIPPNKKRNKGNKKDDDDEDEDEEINNHQQHPENESTAQATAKREVKIQDLVVSEGEEEDVEDGENED